MLQQDLVAAGVEAHRVLAHDAARAHGGDVERVLGQRAIQLGRASALRRRRVGTIAASTLAVPEGASFFCRWWRSSM